MRNSLLTIMLALALVLAATAGTQGETAAPPEGDILMEMLPGGKVTKPSVTFRHDWHAALECTACHHTWDKMSPVKKCKDSQCHADVTTRSGDKAYYLAYHKPGKQSCLGCHKELKKEKAKAFGPTSCKGCHKK